MCLIYSWVESGCPPFIAARLTNRFHYWVLFMKTIDLKVCCICVNMCFIINRMTNSMFRFIDGNDAYEWVYSYTILHDCAFHLVGWKLIWCTIVYTELPVCCVNPCD